MFMGGISEISGLASGMGDAKSYIAAQKAKADARRSLRGMDAVYPAGFVGPLLPEDTREAALIKSAADKGDPIAKQVSDGLMQGGQMALNMMAVWQNAKAARRAEKNKDREERASMKSKWPEWATYAIIGGVVLIGGGILLKKRKK